MPRSSPTTPALGVRLVTVSNAPSSNRTQADFDAMGKTLTAQAAKINAEPKAQASSSETLVVIVAVISILLGVHGAHRAERAEPDRKREQAPPDAQSTRQPLKSLRGVLSRSVVCTRRRRAKPRSTGCSGCRSLRLCCRVIGRCACDRSPLRHS
jgi:hypothetical protein